MNLDYELCSNLYFLKKADHWYSMPSEEHTERKVKHSIITVVICSSISLSFNQRKGFVLGEIIPCASQQWGDLKGHRASFACWAFTVTSWSNILRPWMNAQPLAVSPWYLKGRVILYCLSLRAVHLMNLGFSIKIVSRGARGMSPSYGFHWPHWLSKQCYYSLQCMPFLPQAIYQSEWSKEYTHRHWCACKRWTDVYILHHNFAVNKI